MNDRPAVYDLDGTAPADREILGGKAFSVNRMRSLGLPVPPAFALPTYQCGAYHDAGGQLDEQTWAAVVEAVRRIEQQTGRTFGTGPSPLLVSVRSGAAQSMPGMMDTVLNLGLTPDLVQDLASESGSPEWAEDTWARFCRSYAEIVLGDETGVPPADAWEQLRGAVGAVFDSWTNDRVRAYRSRHGLGAGGGTAVTVQAMVFGNRDQRSGTGVMFSRDPSSGEPVLFGEWLTNAQGEDVVSGEKTPEPLESIRGREPATYAELQRIASTLEAEHRDMVDIEFTVESGRLYMLQCRAGKRSPQAAVRIAADLVREGRLDGASALGRITAAQVATLRDARAADSDAVVLASGLPACPGVASGIGVTDLDDLEARVGAGESVVLVRPFTEPHDVAAMFESVAVVTEVGGATSHAALVCREIGLPCVVGAGEGTVAALVGREVTVDGKAGKVYEGRPEGERTGPDDNVVFLLDLLDREHPGMEHPLRELAGGDS